MKQTLCSLLVFLVVISSSYAIGLAMPPQKTFDAYIGDEFSFKAILVNQEGVSGEYSISLGGSLGDRASARPQSVTIYPPLDVAHRGNSGEDGTATVTITVNSTGLTPGTYSLQVSGSVASGEHGTFNIVQKVTRNIEIRYQYPPSLLNRMLNAVFSVTQRVFNSIIESLKQFHARNRWLDQMFLALIIMTVFYIGLKMNRILRYLGRKKRAFLAEIERIRKHGFKTWLRRKIKDRFKKMQPPIKTEENNDGQKKSSEGGTQ